MPRCNNASMAKNHPQPEGELPSPAKSPPKDRHKAGQKPVRIRHRLAKQLKALADARVTDITELANQAVLEFLKREQFWPPLSAPSAEEAESGG